MKIIQRIEGKEPSPQDVVKAIGCYRAGWLPRIERLESLYRLACPMLNVYKNGVEDKTEKVLSFPIAKYIATISANYVLGDPPVYAPAADLPEEEAEGITAALGEIKSLYRRQTKRRLDRGIKLQCSKTGFAYEYVFVGKDLEPRSCMLPVESTLVVFDDELESDSIYGVTWIREDKQQYRIVVVTETEEIVYRSRGLTAAAGFREDSRKPHYMGRVPITMYRNNEDMTGDYEDVEGLILAYNDLMTDAKFDIKKTVDALLVFYNTKLAGATAEEKTRIREAMKQLGILEISDDEDNPNIKADVKALSNPLNYAQTDVFLDRLWRSIFTLSMVPDPLRTEYFTSLSGIAIKMQLFLGLEPLAKSAEAELGYGLKRRLKMYVHLLSARGRIPDADAADVEIGFRHTAPVNDLEVAQMISMLYGKNVATHETLAGELSFVDDPQREVERAAAENGAGGSNEILRQLTTGLSVPGQEIRQTGSSGGEFS